MIPLARGTRHDIDDRDPSPSHMRFTSILTLVFLGVLAVPREASAVKAWHSGFAAHPTSLPISGQLEARNLRSTHLSPTPSNGPIGHFLSRGDKLTRWVYTPAKRGGGRSAFDPVRGSRRGTYGRLPQVNRVQPHTERGHLPSIQRPRYFTAPH